MTRRFEKNVEGEDGRGAWRSRQRGTMKEKQKRERRGIERAGESFIPLSKVAVVFILFSLPLPPLFFYFLPLVPSAGRRT